MANIDLYERRVLIQRLMTEGVDTYAGRLAAWHNMGNVVGRFATYEELEKAAKADFMVFKSQLRDGLGRPVEAYGTFRLDRDQAAVGNKEAAVFLAPVGKGYEVIQARTLFQVADAMVGAIDGAHYETMGTLDRGRVVWAQIDPNISIRVGDDVSDVLLTVRTSHDGSSNAEIYETSERAVCRNTLRIGRLERLSALLRVSHRRNANAKLQDMKAEIGEIRTQAENMQEMLTILSRKRVTRESYTSIMDRLFPPSERETQGAKNTRRENVLSQILNLYESNDNNAFPTQRGTALNLLNAITEYTDHYRGATNTTRQERAESSQFGTGAKLKESALSLILDEAKTLPEMLSARPSIVADDVVSELVGAGR